MPQDTLKRSAYAAVGAPVSLVNMLRERVAAAREAIEEARGRVSEEMTEAFERWAEEGEQLISSLTEDVQHRRQDIEERIDQGREELEDRAVRGRRELEERFEYGKETVKDVGRGLGATLTEPIVAVEAVVGIGPSHARELAKAGVLSTRALVERAGTGDARARLAKQTGIGTALLEKWARSADLTRINGVGEENASILNALEVGTLEQMANQDPEDLKQRAETLRQDTGIVAAVPSVETLTQWIAEAKKLVST
jgi:predicted flap endonuclease-1-like 5' DNA nuclease